MLQASWGTGKAYYSNNAQPIEITPENPFCRFKAIGYSALPKYDDKDGLVSLVFKKKASELEAGKAQLITSISGVLGNKPNIKVSVNNIKATSADTSEAVIVVEESAQNGQIRKVPASEMGSFFNQPAQAQNLKNFGVEMVVPKTSISDSDLKDYLENSPKGIDPRLWKQAQDDNPNPKVYIPVPLLGFKSVMQRIKMQEDQGKAHQGRLDAIADDISELQKKHQATVAALEESKRRQLELSHRVLKVLVRQESTRKHGFTITPEEERLRSQLETIQTKLETPTQFKGKLNELLSQVFSIRLFIFRFRYLVKAKNEIKSTKNDIQCLQSSLLKDTDTHNKYIYLDKHFLYLMYVMLLLFLFPLEYLFIMHNYNNIDI